MRVLLVHSSSAGVETVPAAELIALLRDNGFAPDRVVSMDDDFDRETLRGTDLIVVAGGDGTVARTVALLPEPEVPVAILPTGGSNNIARALGVEGDLETLAAGLADGRYAPLDVGAVEGDWGCSSFVEAVGFGALTESLCNIDREPQSAGDKLAIGRAAFRDSIGSAEAADYEFTIDGERFRETLLMLEVLNIAAIGPWLRLAPKAGPGDGLLHAAGLAPADRDKFVQWLDHMEGAPPLTIRTGRDIRLLDGPARVRPDDPKRVRDRHGQPVRIGLRPQQARILVPAPSNQR